MTRKPRELSADEKRLWRRVAEGVKARRGKALPDEPPASAEPVGVKKEAAVRLAPAPSKSTLKKAPTPPADRGSERRVQRGQVEIEGRLDLHGHTYDSARAAVRAFVQRAQADGARTVLVITGYGRGGEGVLKKGLPDWIAEPSLRAIVSGYARAHRTHGGAGAVYIFLKRK